MSFKQLLNLKGVKNFEKYDKYNHKIIEGLSNFRIGYASNFHLYVPESKFKIPEMRICYITAEENCLLVSEVASNLPSEQRYSVYYKLLDNDLRQDKFFLDKNKEGSYIINDANIDHFISIVNNIFNDVKRYVKMNNIPFEPPNIKKLGENFIITPDKIDMYLREQREFRSFEQIKDISRRMISTVSEFDIFLSHRKLDEREVEYIWNFLHEKGFTVYIDWIVDEALDRKSVSRKTADVIKKRMNQSKCLLYLFTVNSNKSKWMPWELGCFDGMNKKIAVLTYSSSKTRKNTFIGQEYLQLYPVCDDDLRLESGEKLKDWINRK